MRRDGGDPVSASRHDQTELTHGVGDAHPLFSGERHRQVTRIATESWFTSETIPVLETGSVIGGTDPDAWMISESHFDDCYWNEGRDWVISHRSSAVDATVDFASSGL